jgi:hypothetical protein
MTPLTTRHFLRPAIPAAMQPATFALRLQVDGNQFQHPMKPNLCGFVLIGKLQRNFGVLLWGLLRIYRSLYNMTAATSEEERTLMIQQNLLPLN